MEKEFVPYELAVKLKALGFDEPCFGSWETDNTETPAYTHSISGNYRNSNHPIGKTSAPTYSQAFRWFREKYHRPHIWLMDELLDTGEYTYEEAELACLTKLIEIVEQSKN